MLMVTVCCTVQLTGPVLTIGSRVLDISSAGCMGQTVEGSAGGIAIAGATQNCTGHFCTTGAASHCPSTVAPRGIVAGRVFCDVSSAGFQTFAQSSEEGELGAVVVGVSKVVRSSSLAATKEFGSCSKEGNCSDALDALRLEKVSDFGVAVLQCSDSGSVAVAS